MPVLPAQPGPLIGREIEAPLVQARLLRDDVRLLTLVGPAGTGKTRLAVEVAHLAAQAFADGTYFVDLAPVSDPALLTTAIAQAVEIREERDRPLIDVLKHGLGNRSILLLLDNFEQLLSAAAQLSDLVQTCPRLKLLVTSRAALRLQWEHVVPVSPLAVPDMRALPRLELLEDVPAVQLFVRRAQRMDPHFGITYNNSHAVAEVCVRLDGLPLAIELAAARTRVLPPESLLNRLGHRLDILAGANHDQPARQRTLRGALDWSYELLSPSEQAVFRRLGVFVGGFPFGAVAEVCDPAGELGIDPLTAIESLFDNSLIRQERGQGAEPRFGMLETIREYALERLAERGELEQTRRHHARYFLIGADVPIAEMKISQQTAWLQSLEAEHDNLRAALAWCDEAREPELGLSAAGLLSWFWIVRGYVAEGRRQMSALLALTGDERSAFRAEALRVIGSLALHQADYRAARELFDESLAIRRELGDPAGLLSALTSLGAVAMQQGDHAAAESAFLEALAIQQAIEDRLGMAESFNNLANVAHEQGHLERARELYERSLAVQNAGLRYRVDVVLHNLGVVAEEQGDLAEARKLFQDSVAMKRSLGDTAGLALSLAKLGQVVSSTGDLEAAQRYLAEALSLQRDQGDRAGIAFVLERCAMTAAEHGGFERALRLGAAAEALRRAIGAPLGASARGAYEKSLQQARAGLSPDDAYAAWAAGQAMPIDQVIVEALTVEPRNVPKPAPTDASGLSPREREVATLVALGLSNRDIAERLVVSERTAENHVQRVMNRLGFRSRTQVATWAVRHGLTDGT